MSNQLSGDGYRKLKAVFAKLRSEMPKQLQVIGHALALEAAARAPSPQEEYNVMMVGDGNREGITNIPGMPSSLASSDGDHRLRFYKPAGFYLQPVIANNVQMTGPLQVSLGSEAELNTASQYIWRNVNGQEFTSTFPFWEAWEYGLNSTFYIEPRNHSKRPMLTPGLGKENKRQTMTKAIPRMRMYGSVEVEEKIDTDLIPAIRKLVRET